MVKRPMTGSTVGGMTEIVLNYKNVVLDKVKLEYVWELKAQNQVKQYN